MAIGAAVLAVVFLRRVPARAGGETDRDVADSPGVEPGARSLHGAGDAIIAGSLQERKP